MPSSNGKTFKGWKVNDTDEIVSTKDAIDRVITKDTDFYAHYKEVEPTKYTITFKNDDGSIIETFKVEENNSFNYSTIPTPKLVSAD